MKVLWFTNTSLPGGGPEFGAVSSGSGGWLHGLEKALRTHADVSIGVATACRSGKDLMVRDGEVCHYRIAVPDKNYTRVMQLEPSKEFVAKCREVVDSFDPDLIHVHGTEQTYGLLTARDRLKRPSVVSIQGLLCGCYPYLHGKMGLLDLARCHNLMNLIFRSGIFFYSMRCIKRCEVEREILDGNGFFIGRTFWDRAQLRAHNPDAVYMHGDEALRPEFYSSGKCRQEADHPVIFATWGQSPLRGTHVLLKALVFVARELPDVELRLARGEFNRPRWFRGYYTHLDRHIQELGIEGSLTLLPGLDAESFANELLRSHAFVQASYVENSSNSLCEAMMMGTPCVASVGGGTGSLVDEGKTALCFPPGEHAVLAERLIEVLRDKELRTRLSENARAVAAKRHNPELIARRTMEIYRHVLSQC
jgi:glycosyltransferase involved in cell wall biosynthesis